jgi:hypothetical protein
VKKTKRVPTAHGGFDLARRERFLALMAVGKTIEEAAATAGISRTSVARWAARGRAPDALTEHRSFAERFDAIRQEFAERDAADEHEPSPAAEWVEGDPFVALAPDEMAELTPEQQQRAREVSEAAHERTVAVQRSRRARAGAE